jgi:hypothetical protein
VTDASNNSFVILCDIIAFLIQSQNPVSVVLIAWSRRFCVMLTYPALTGVISWRKWTWPTPTQCIYLKYVLIIFSRLCLNLPGDVLLAGSPILILYVVFIFHMLVTCTAISYFVDLSSYCHLVEGTYCWAPHCTNVSSCFDIPYCFLSTPFSPSVWSSLRALSKSFISYRTKCKIIITTFFK